MKRFFEKWDELKAQLEQVRGLFYTENEDWSNNEKKVEVYKVDNDKGIKKLHVEQDEEDARYIIATVAYRDKDNQDDTLSESLHLTCLIIFRIDGENKFSYKN